MTELEKCLAGECYNPHDVTFLAFKNNARNVLLKYNNLAYFQKEEKAKLLEKLFGSVGANVSVAMPFVCDYGCNIHVGNNVAINMNCTFIDCNKIEIGNNVIISSNVRIYTSTHPVELEERMNPEFFETGEGYFIKTYALPVKIGNGCWIGGGATILPGVTIGDGAVIGAGSVVTRDIPANTLAVGCPCRVIKEINKK